MEYASEEFLGRESPGPLEAVQDFLSSLLEVITSALARSANRRNCSVAKMAQGRKASQDGSRVNHSAEIIPFRKAFFRFPKPAARWYIRGGRRCASRCAPRSRGYVATGHMLNAALGLRRARISDLPRHHHKQGAGCAARQGRERRADRWHRFVLQGDDQRTADPQMVAQQGISDRAGMWAGVGHLDGRRRHR